MMQRQQETTRAVLEEVMAKTDLGRYKREEIRHRYVIAKGWEEADLLHDMNQPPAENDYFRDEDYRGFGYYVALSSLPLSLVAYACFFLFGPWGALAFLVPGVAVVVGMYVDEREEG